MGSRRSLPKLASSAKGRHPIVELDQHRAKGEVRARPEPEGDGTRVAKGRAR